MSKLSDSIQRGLEEAVAYAKGEADPRLYRVSAVDAKALNGQTDLEAICVLTGEEIK